MTSNPRDPSSADPTFDLSGKAALITGAGGLLGAVHAEALARHGANLLLTDLDEAVCAERAAGFEEEFGISAWACRLDVTSPASWDAALARMDGLAPRVDILVNNAGYTTNTRSESYDASFESFPLEDWNAILDVNLTGTLLGCQHVGRRMVEWGGGSIINLASLYGVVSPHHPIYGGTGIVQPVAYSVSKAGVLGLTRYVAALWATEGVRVNAITPGGIFDGQSDEFVSGFEKLNPMARMGDRQEIAGAIVFLASDASSYCTGHNLVVDGGWTIW